MTHTVCDSCLIHYRGLNAKVQKQAAGDASIVEMKNIFRPDSYYTFELNFDRYFYGKNSFNY
jgi:hypothetical protein